MYQCKRCSLDFETRKKLLEHTESCSAKTIRENYTPSYASDSEQKIRRSKNEQDTRSRSRSREDTDTEKTIEKYKDEIRKYKSELKKRVSTHRDELASTQEYYQEQLDLVIEERDSMQEQLEEVTDKIFREKERLRTEFNRKLDDEKRKLIGIYGDKSNLQETIEKLTDELSRVKEERESLVFSMDTKHQIKVKELQDKVKSLKKSLENEKEALDRKIQVLQNENSMALVQFTRDKDLEIENLNSEKRAEVSTMQMTISSLKKDIDALKNIHQRVLLEKDTVYQLDLKDKVDMISRLKENNTRNMETFNEKKEGQIRLIKAEHEKKIAELSAQHQVQLSAVEHERDITLSSMRDDTERQRTRYEQELDDLRKRLDKSRQDIDTQINDKQTEFNKSLERVKNDHVQLRENIESKLRQEYQDLIAARDSTILEIERLNHALGGQLENYRSTLDNINTNTLGVKEQFVTNLNKQKQDYEDTIRNKEEKIKDLTTSIARVTAKHNSVIAEHEVIVRNMTQEYEACKDNIKKLQDKLSTVTSDYENLLNKHRETIKKNAGKIDLIKQEFTTKMNEQKIELEGYNTRKTAELMGTLDSVRSELEQTKENFGVQRTELTGKIEKLQGLVSEKDIQQEKLRIVCERLNEQASKYIETLSGLKSRLEEEITKSKIATGVIQERDQQLTILKTLNERLSKNTQELVTRVRELESIPKEDLEKTKKNEELLAEQEALLKKTRSKCEELNKQVQAYAMQLKTIKDEHAKDLVKVKTDCAAEISRVNADKEGITDQSTERIEELQSELAREQEQVKALRTDLDKKNEQMESLKIISSQLNSQISSLRAEFKRQTDSYQKEMTKITQMHEETDAKHTETTRDEIRKLTTKYTGEIEGLFRENQDLKTKLDTFLTKDVQLEDKLKKLRAESLDSMRKQKDQIEQLKQENIILDENNKKLTEKYTEHEKSHQTLVSDHKLVTQQLTEKIDSLGKELDTRQERVQQLEKLLTDAMGKIVAKN